MHGNVPFAPLEHPRDVGETLSHGPPRFEILSALGHGGFGVVYLARYWGGGGFTRLVALKVLRDSLAMPDEVARRMRDEARILGLLRHRAIVTVDRMLTLGGRAAIVMEYIEGASLAELVRRGPVPPVIALELVGEIAQALHIGFHSPGSDGRPLKLLHRDIKLANVLVTRHGEVKVLDFGIARAEFWGREAETQSLTFGSPTYIAPERLEHIEGPEGDIYSLGVVLWELLTRRSMPRTLASAERFTARQHEAMEALADVDRWLPVGTYELVQQMLSYEPAHRPTALDVERRCLALRRGTVDEPLRFWAEGAVPPLTQARARPDPAGWVGCVLVEGDADGAVPMTLPAGDGASDTRDTQSTRPSQPSLAQARVAPPPPYDEGRRASGLAAGIGIALSLTLVGTCLGLALRLSRAPPLGEVAPVEPPPGVEETPVQVPSVTEPPVTEPTVEPQIEAAPVDTTPVATRADNGPVAGATTPTSPSPRPAKPKKKATPKCASSEIPVVVEGDESITLTRAGLTTTLPGCVQLPGPYQASLNVKGTPQPMGTLLIQPNADGSAVKVSCSGGACRLRTFTK